MFSLSLLLLCLACLASAADHYKILDCTCPHELPDVLLISKTVHRSASDKDIRHAYKRLSKRYHPDKNKEKGAEDKFVEIAHGGFRACIPFRPFTNYVYPLAYEILSDPTVSNTAYNSEGSGQPPEIETPNI